jgi:outer membrane protein insertion porin family
VLKYDNRDDPLLPRSGYTMTLEPKLSMVGIASEANFGTIVGTVTGIVPLKPLGERFSLGLVASGGLSQPWGSTTEIPITQRFYLGGRTTVRGYDQNSLGPEGENGAIIGGDTLLLAKGQFQYLLFDSFSTHLFLDAGNVWLRHVDFDLSAIKQGSGAGFQYLSPIGPIGLDLGTPLNPNTGDPRFLVTFSVGSVF